MWCTVLALPTKIPTLAKKISTPSCSRVNYVNETLYCTWKMYISRRKCPEEFFRDQTITTLKAAWWHRPASWADYSPRRSTCMGGLLQENAAGVQENATTVVDWCHTITITKVCPVETPLSMPARAHNTHYMYRLWMRARSSTEFAN